MDTKRQKSIGTFLLDENKHGHKSRCRNRFVQIIKDRTKEVNAERNNLLKQYAEKNKKKEVLYLDENGKETTDLAKSKNFKITPENLKKVEDEFAEYLDEDYIIDVTPANRDIMENVKDILLNSLADVKGLQSVMYDEWCQAFENIKEDKKEKK